MSESAWGNESRADKVMRRVLAIADEVRLSDTQTDYRVRHPPQSGWLEGLGHLKGGRPINLNVALKRVSVP